MNLGYGIQIVAWGEFALFTRPEMKVERVSYDIITPSAVRGLIEAVYWHPGMKWVIDQIFICNPIRFNRIRRNEVGLKLSANNAYKTMYGKNSPLYINTSEVIQQRASLVLTDVRYIISAHFEITHVTSPCDPPQKFYSIVNRRLKSGKRFMQPYFGCREFSANVKLFSGNLPQCNETLKGTHDLGYMLYDMDYSDPDNIRPTFFRAILHDGLLNLEDCEMIS